MNYIMPGLEHGP